MTRAEVTEREQRESWGALKTAAVDTRAKSSGQGLKRCAANPQREQRVHSSLPTRPGAAVTGTGRGRRVCRGSRVVAARGKRGECLGHCPDTADFSHPTVQGTK